METSLHRQLKALYAAANGLVEQRVGRYRIDVVRGTQLVEIQLASLTAIRDKIATLLKNHDVLVVKPLVVRKHLVKRRRAAGRIVSRRLRPKRRTMLDLFEELVHFTRVYPHARLTLEVALIDVLPGREEEFGAAGDALTLTSSKTSGSSKSLKRISSAPPPISAVCSPLICRVRFTRGSSPKVSTSNAGSPNAWPIACAKPEPSNKWVSSVALGCTNSPSPMPRDNHRFVV